MNTLEHTLTELEIPAASRRVYLFLASNGASPARIIAEQLNIPRPSVYDHVAPLLEKGIVALLERDGKKVFVISSMDDLVRLIKEKEERIMVLKGRLLHERDHLVKQTETIDPKIKFFEGKEGIAQLLLDVLWSGTQMIDTVWPYYEMLKVLGEDVLEDFNKKRIRHKIPLRSVWTDRPKGRAHIWKGGDWKVERRFAPKGFAPRMGYSVYGDKVSFIASHDELYGFVVHSRDFARLKAAEFELLWKSCKGD